MFRTLAPLASAVALVAALAGCTATVAPHDPVRVPEAPAGRMVGPAPTAAVYTVAPAIPPCASDDYNSTGLSLCYIVRVTDGAVLVVDEHDEVVSVAE